jgi:hypothetical protein
MADALRWLSMACLGVFLGAQVTEGFLLVPYWQSLAPADFLAWYAANDRRLLDFFGPLTTMVVLLSCAAAALSVWQAQRGRGFAVAAALLALVILSLFFVYFQSVNASFAAGTISPNAVPAELARWATWHWVRIMLAALAFGAALISVRR